MLTLRASRDERLPPWSPIGIAQMLAELDQEVRIIEEIADRALSGPFAVTRFLFFAYYIPADVKENVRRRGIQTS